MATKRKTVKIRDTEATNRRFVAAVRKIMRDHGHHMLSQNHIALMAGRDRKLIGRNFGSKNNLLERYITEADYWPPFFERYKIDGSADQKEVREMFTALMLENFSRFYGDTEMQKIILWQISERNPLLRSISEKREREGKVLLKLTDPTFLKTEVSFQAILCLLLGGSYYVALHAHTNKSSVCGIDINWEHDRKLLEKTIAQVIGWAYEHAHEQNQNTLPMNYEFDNLEILIGELSEKRNDEGAKADPRLTVEIKKAERQLSSQLLGLTNETQIATFLHLYLGKLIKLSNTLYAQGTDNLNAALLLELMETMRAPVAQYIPETLVLPKLFRENETRKFTQLWSFIEKPLLSGRIDKKLLEIIQLPLKRFENAKEEMRWCDFKYLKRYLDVLGELVSEAFSEQTLIEHLIGLGFNATRFNSFYANRLKQSLPIDLTGTIKLLEQERARLQQLAVFTKRNFDNRKMPIIEELLKWIDAEISLHKKESWKSWKFISKFKATELATWHKLLQEHGVLNEENLVVLFEKIAHNYSTGAQEQLSAKSLQSKSYATDRSVYLALEKPVLAILEDIRRFL